MGFFSCLMYLNHTGGLEGTEIVFVTVRLSQKPSQQLSSPTNLSPPVFSVSVTGTGSHPVAQTRNVYIAFPFLCYLIHHPVPGGDIFSLVCLFAQPLLPLPDTSHSHLNGSSVSPLFVSPPLHPLSMRQTQYNIVMLLRIPSDRDNKIMKQKCNLKFRGLLLAQRKALLLLPIHSAIKRRYFEFLQGTIF